MHRTGVHHTATLGIDLNFIRLTSHQAKKRRVHRFSPVTSKHVCRLYQISILLLRDRSIALVFDVFDASSPFSKLARAASNSASMTSSLPRRRAPVVVEMVSRVVVISALVKLVVCRTALVVDSVVLAIGSVVLVVDSSELVLGAGVFAAV